MIADVVYLIFFLAWIFLGYRLAGFLVETVSDFTESDNFRFPFGKFMWYTVLVVGMMLAYPRVTSSVHRTTSDPVAEQHIEPRTGGKVVDPRPSLEEKVDALEAENRASNEATKETFDK